MSTQFFPTTSFLDPLAPQPAVVCLASLHAPLPRKATFEARSLRSRPALRSSSHELRVLIVDSNALSLDSMIKTISQWTSSVQWAFDGYAALRCAAVQHPQVVILQRELPWMSGFQLATHLRRDFPGDELFLVGLTESKSLKDRQLSIESGIDILLADGNRIAQLEVLLMLESVRHTLRKTGSS